MLNWAEKSCKIPCSRIVFHGDVVESHNTKSNFCLEFAYTIVEKHSGRDIMSFNVETLSTFFSIIYLACYKLAANSNICHVGILFSSKLDQIFTYVV